MEKVERFVIVTFKTAVFLNIGLTRFPSSCCNCCGCGAHVAPHERSVLPQRTLT